MRNDGQFRESRLGLDSVTITVMKAAKNFEQAAHFHVYSNQHPRCMARRLHSEDGELPLTNQLAATGDEIRAKYGPNLGWKELLRLLEDRTLVRYPCEVRFDGDLLLPGEFAHSVPKGARPEEGFTIFVHPCFASQLPLLPPLVLYQLALITCGNAASPDDAEILGAHALGLQKDQYFRVLCELADQIGGDEML